MTELVTPRLYLTEVTPELWLIIRREDRMVAGVVQVTPRGETAELGYHLEEEYRGKGYMTQALEALCPVLLGKGRFSRLTARTRCDNAASQRVLRACGFTSAPADEFLLWQREK